MSVAGAIRELVASNRLDLTTEEKDDLQRVASQVQQHEFSATAKPPQVVGSDLSVFIRNITIMGLVPALKQFVLDIFNIKPTVAAAGEHQTLAGAPTLPYPTVLPLDSVSQLLAILRGGQLVSSAQAFAKHAWIVVGYCLFLTVGEPTTLVRDAATELDEETRQTLAELHKELDSTASISSQFKGADPGAASNAFLLLIADYLRKLLAKVLTLA